jgi:drug/metabolite transporter (DMT)-like permease
MNLLYQLAVSAVLMIAIAPLFGAPIREPTIAIYAFFAFQVIVIVAIGFLLWFWILSIYPISNMASFSLLAPGFGILFGWMIFDDPLTPSFFDAIFLIGAGLVITNRPPHNATKQGIDHGSSP